MSKKLYIPQESLILLSENVVNESLSQMAYHFTTLKGYYEMLYKDGIKLSPIEHYHRNSFLDDNGRAKYFLSTTRVRDSRFGYSTMGDRNVRLELNSNAINANYKAKPVSFFHSFSDADKSIKNYYSHNSKIFNDAKKTQVEVENEDRIFFDIPILYNIPKYVQRADILINVHDSEIKNLLYDDSETYVILKQILTLSNMWTRTFVYNDRHQFNVQGQNITEKLFELF